MYNVDEIDFLKDIVKMFRRICRSLPGNLFKPKQNKLGRLFWQRCVFKETIDGDSIHTLLETWSRIGNMLIITLIIDLIENLLFF